jgi:uncharacterized protein YifN (PemK superfamily)
MDEPGSRAKLPFTYVKPEFVIVLYARAAKYCVVPISTKEGLVKFAEKMKELDSDFNQHKKETH